MTTRRVTDVAHHLIAAGYGVAALFAAFPFVDTLAQVWPFRLSSPSWRYGTVGLGANYLISVVFGVGLACLIAALAQHRRTLRALALAGGIGAALLVAGVLLFALDALQVRAGVPAGAPDRWMFDVGVAKAVFKYGASAVVMAALALGSRRAWRSVPAHSKGEAPKLVGTQGS